jgi:opacity protein-like surface antigen
MTMRVLKLAGLAGALALLPAIAGAQDARSISFGVMGGLSLPMGDLADGVESGFNITGNLYMPLGDKLKLRADLGYESFAGKGSNSIAGFDFNVLSVTGNVIFPLGMERAEGGIRPYLIGGGGLYRGTIKANIVGISDSESSSDLGINVGGGFEFKLSGFTTFAEARFVNVFSDGESSNWIPITFGIRF